MRAGHVGDDPVLLARQGDTFYAVDALCTHYHGPLAEGRLAGTRVHCPWHHACFELATGAAVGAPARDDLGCWAVVREGDRVRVTERRPVSRPTPRPAKEPASVVLVGGGPAGEAAAETLRREGYTGPVTMISADPALPVDRPNLSKDFLAGTVPVAWLPLRDATWYRDHGIDVRLETGVAAVEARASRLRLTDGSTLGYGGLLLATGAAPRRLAVPGADHPHVHTLRDLGDAAALVAAVEAGARRAVVVGAGFIGLEVAASLRRRGLSVEVVDRASVPLAPVMGERLGAFVRGLHEAHGVTFHLGRTVHRIDPEAVVLDDGTRLAADLVVVGLGVTPRTVLAETAGLEVDDGILVDAHLQTKVPGIYAAGDVCRYPDPRTGERVRVEHFVVAQRQGQLAARNLLGAAEPFTDPPFFWSQHYDAVIAYVGHAPRWDRVDEQGDPAAMDYAARFYQGERLLAVATIFRDGESLAVEAELAAEAREG